MSYNEASKEDKILQAAKNIFLLYGYHGSTLKLIAIEAGVHTSVIHYYFRSKERLYTRVIEKIIKTVLNSDEMFNAIQNGFEKQKWFLYTELYNNEYLFERSLKKLYPNDWNAILIELKKTLQKKKSSAFNKN